jgi:putative phage-type endonuclease
MAESIINIADMPTVQQLPTFEEWRRNRGTYLGGSDVASILGLSPYPDCTPGNVWAEKVRGLERLGAGDPQLDPEMENRFTKWGKRLERVVIDEYEDQMGVKVPRPGWTLFRHPDHPFIAGTLDGDDTIFPSGDVKIVEAKTTDGWTQYRTQMWGPSGSDEVPEWYYVQAMQYLIVKRALGSKATMCDFAVLIGGNDFRILHVRFDEELAQEMIQRQIEFWRLVETRTPPQFDYRAKGAADLQRKIWSKIDGPTRIVSPDYRIDASQPTIVELIAQHDEAKREKEDAEARLEAAKAQLLHIAGNASAVRIGDSPLGLVRTPKKGYDVPGYHVDDRVEMSFQPRFEKKRREILNELTTKKQ